MKNSSRRPLRTGRSHKIKNSYDGKRQKNFNVKSILLGIILTILFALIFMYIYVRRQLIKIKKNYSYTPEFLKISNNINNNFDASELSLDPNKNVEEDKHDDDKVLDDVDQDTSQENLSSFSKQLKNGNNKWNRHDPAFKIDGTWGISGLKYIELHNPNIRSQTRRDRFVVFPDEQVEVPPRFEGSPSRIVGEPREYLKAVEILKNHPLHKRNRKQRKQSLEDAMTYLKNQPSCSNLPIFLSMAQAKDELYWQLIENFVYTSVKFKTSDCALVICVSDSSCMKMCEDSFFPCFKYQTDVDPAPSAMEQIAQLKLLHIPRALDRGVDVFMLDLDVGFLGDPKLMVKVFRETPVVDILVQEDKSFVMNRTKAGWKQWYTVPLPNIGLFLCRGNPRTVRVFDIAWGKYQRIKDPRKKTQPGKDQNHVLDAMRAGRSSFGLKYAYFTNETAPLLDKLVLNYDTTVELGGEAMSSLLHSKHSLAIHTTCFAKSTKVMGLKASNAFWNPKYYDPLRPTITKPILYKDEKQLLDEVRSLAWLAFVTNRSVIIPNLLGPETFNEVARYRGQSMWPGFRVVFMKRANGRNLLRVNILEPGYYWRVQRDYDDIPEPTIVYFNPDEDSLKTLRDKILQLHTSPRLVLQQFFPGLTDEEVRVREEQLRVWANDSVGLFSESYSEKVVEDRGLPSLKDVRREPDLTMVNDFLQGMRNCQRIFKPFKGNRTCFQQCK